MLEQGYPPPTGCYIVPASFSGGVAPSSAANTRGDKKLQKAKLLGAIFVTQSNLSFANRKIKAVIVVISYGYKLR